MAHRVILAAPATVLLSTVLCHANELPGESGPLGNGSVATYTVLSADGAPAEIGVQFSAGAFEGLPHEKNPTSRCFDLDGNGGIDAMSECEGDHQLILPLAIPADAGAETPFTFAMVNYNPHGHPPEAWSVPHFDIHFYSVPFEDVKAIRTGPCPFFIDCDDQKRALMPVPAKYVHPDFADVGATVGMMGNHLIDTKTAELASPGTPFTHTFIFGAYDGRVIFHEVMVTTAFLGETGDLCTAIKQPEARQVAGYYPAQYCFRRDPADGSTRVYLTGFSRQPAG